MHNGATPFLLTQPIHQQQQFGGSVGGPLIKDRLFYFFTYDGFRRVGRVLYSDSNQVSLTPNGTFDPTVKANSTLVTPNQCPTASNSSYASYNPANPHYYITDAQCTAGINFLLKVANVGTGDEPPSRFAETKPFFPAPRLSHQRQERCVRGFQLRRLR